MSLDITTQGPLHLEKLADMAIGQLYSNLGLVARTTRWFTNSIIQNGGTFSIPIVGNLSSNTRAPGASVTDQTPTPSKRAISIIERETSYIVDPTHEDSEAGQAYKMQQMTNAVNALATDITTDMLNILANSGGVATVGTLGVAVTEPDYQAGRQAMTDDSIPVDPRVAIVTPQTMTDTVNITNYSRMDANGTQGAFSEGTVRKASGFELIESPYVDQPIPGTDANNLLLYPRDVYSVFPKQGEINKRGQMKVESEIDGMRIAILEEPVSGQNGAYRMTVSSRYGFRLGRDESLILLLGRS